MRRTLLAGGLLALGAALLADHGGHVGIEATRVALFGVVMGAVLACAGGAASPTGRAAAAGVGFVAGWAGYAARAAVLPDIPLGRAVAAFGVVAVVTVTAAATRERLPLWSGLLGVGLIGGAYETTFTASPPAFATESVTAATAALLAAGVGYLVATLVAEPASVSAARAGEITVTQVVTLPEQRSTPTDVPTRTEA